MTKRRINHKKSLYIQINILYELKKDLPDSEQKHIEKYIYLAHVINTRFHQNKELDINGFVPINKRLFQNRISSRREGEIFKFYMDHNIIEVNPTYTKGEISKGYRFTAAFKGSPILKIESKVDYI